MKDKARQEEYDRRLKIWKKVCLAAHSAAQAELGEVLSVEIEALAKGNDRGFFEALLVWAVEPLLGHED